MLGFSKKRPKRPRTAPNERVYAIGDIHGRHDLLKQLLQKIIRHWEESDGNFKRIKLIFLGDIIDRGPDSNRCLSLVEKLARNSGAELIMGNHEDLMLRAMKGDQEAQDIWMEHGGIETLKSFGLAKPSTSEDSIDFGDRVRKAIPDSYVAMLENAATHLVSGDYFFVHAGVRPDIALKDQSDFDKFFIRTDFTESEKWHGAMIVHGHTIVDEVEMYSNRIAVDTGAYRTDRLSCLCLQGTLRHIINT